MNPEKLIEFGILTVENVSKNSIEISFADGDCMDEFINLLAEKIGSVFKPVICAEGLGMTSALFDTNDYQSYIEPILV